jgi:membrane fusion protein, multidrug efflux system
MNIMSASSFFNLWLNSKEAWLMLKINRSFPVFFLTLVSSLSILFAGCGKKEAPSVLSAIPVVVTQAIQKDMPVYREFVGQTLGSQDVEIRARVEGYLQSVDFKEGSFVKKGDLLYQIDPKNFQTTLDQANGKLGEAEASFQKNQNDVNRYRPLAAEKAISQQELDNAESAFMAAKAALDSAKAAVEEATLNLGYTRIEAPIDGLIDTSRVKPGNLVGRGENTLLTILSQIDPMDIRISLSESDYLIFARAKAARDAKRQAGPDSPIQMILADGTVYEHPGAVNFVERAVDPTTGTLSVRISFPNPGKILRPGQYGKVRAARDVKKGAILVPQRAVSELQGLFRVAVVGADNKISMKTVSVGDRFDDLWQITDGLAAGENVVVEGIQKVRDGVLVTPTPMQPTPAGDTTPTA